MPDKLTTFIHNENIKHFCLKIEQETDPGRLEILKLLLKEEEARPGQPDVKTPEALELAAVVSRMLARACFGEG